MRRYVKKCEAVGLDRNFYRAYHRNHVNEMMLTAFSDFSFEDSMDNDGDDVKLGLFQAQSYKVSEKLVQELVRQADGLIRQTGLVKQRR